MWRSQEKRGSLGREVKLPSRGGWIHYNTRRCVKQQLEGVAWSAAALLRDVGWCGVVPMWLVGLGRCYGNDAGFGQKRERAKRSG